MASPTHLTTRETATGTNRDGLEFVIRTTHPARKDQTHVLYHISRAPRKPHLFPL